MSPHTSRKSGVVLCLFVLRHRYVIALCVCANVFFMFQYCAFLLPDIHRNENSSGVPLSVRRSSQKHKRWIALGRLDGELFHREALAFNCTQSPLLKKTNLTWSGLQTYGFFGSELYSYHQSVDIVEKICRFRRGECVMKDSLKDKDFPLLITAEDLCPEDVSAMIELLILVKSAVDHFGQRKLIRNSWGNMSCWRGRSVRLVFITACTNNTDELDTLDKESQKHGDIIQEDFLENYYRTTHKVVFGLRWGLAFCPGAKWFLFTDDDTFVNPPGVLRFLDGVQPHLDTRMVAGTISGSRVIRGNRGSSKWSVTPTLYPYKMYPPYIAGGAVFIGANMALDLYVGSRFINYYPLDDVFFGLIMNKLLVRPVHLNGVLPYFPRIFRSKGFKSVLTIHGRIRRRNISWLWKKWHLENVCQLNPRSSYFS
ncbi:unnamed protein product [Calicophoron daubneyi]|uniref:Hexosyltransferase n=1 Tax=Calicophoron daubneyi TaxID=300641 RepID=A0AAV2TXN8_CALDB